MKSCFDVLLREGIFMTPDITQLEASVKPNTLTKQLNGLVILNMVTRSCFLVQCSFGHLKDVGEC